MMLFKKEEEREFQFALKFPKLNFNYKNKQTGLQV